MAWHRSNQTSKRLDENPGRWSGAGSGLPVRSECSRSESGCRSNTRGGGKDKLGSINKQGDRYLRSLFTADALAVIRYAKMHGTKHRP
jgi:transposase